MSTDTPQSSLVGGAPIVVIEDEEDILDVVEYNLVRAGHVVTRARDGRTGLDAIRRTAPALVVLDIMLPGLDGIEICRELRRHAATLNTPVLVLTAKSEEADIVRGHEAGADDYVTKPFRPAELVARVNAMLRRGSRNATIHGSGKGSGTGGGVDGDGVDDDVAADESRLVHNGLVVNPSRHEVVLDGTPLTLTRTELRLLYALVERPGRVFRREQLVSRAIGADAWVTERTIDVHIRGIRRKLGERADMVETIRGVGYRLRDES
ncbi:MAG: response regulator transcription factor [Thermoleophilia bacterium]|nr:response regulator transcription factor [Thermoleophilia bacterium]